MLASSRLDLRKSKVLVVDDNPQSLDLMSQILIGFRVERALGCRSAEEAREHLLTTTFDLILIDGEMPAEDGISLTRAIRRQPEQPNFTAPIVIVSGYTPEEKVLRARDAGANLVLRKPLAPSTLLARIEWLARNTREFVTTATYCGPDRRFQHLPLPDGVEERRQDALAIAAHPERAMSQNEIDSLFG